MRTILVSALLLTAFACGVDQSYFEREIEGEWFGQEWLREGQPTGYRAWMKFEPADSSYRAVFNENLEAGTYWIDGNRLYTHADGSQPIKVRIESIENDIMTIGMNRGGQSETITFSRKQ
ncbi:MAG: lipocalin family protein [Saprospiraceae bacterium]|nr:lipocalin family protein [Saprospiraceae bacterium]